MIINYDKSIKKNAWKPKYLRNSIRAFVSGGSICLFGQILLKLYELAGFEKEETGSLMIVTLILIASLLTGIGVFDKIGQWAGAGSLVPVTGFANSMTSAALEYKKEGLVLGVATNLFKLAGAVITFGVVSAYILGMLRYLIENFVL
ncbi:stage V sporulation protein AC [Mycoplasmatota bacterium]|nr:stage V sporulation protein AC [Mycoplasmatota bacterium]